MTPPTSGQSTPARSWFDGDAPFTANNPLAAPIARRPLQRLEPVAALFLRWALAAAFLSAVADRLGLFGPYGTPGVLWGDFAHFSAYTAQLTPFATGAMGSALAGIATAAELVLGVALALGLFTRWAAVASGVLLLVFALVMSAGVGLRATLETSVFAASAGAFLLATVERHVWAMDRSVRRRRRLHADPLATETYDTATLRTP